MKKLIYTSSIDVVFGGAPIKDGDESLPYPVKFLDYYSYSKSLAEKDIIAAPPTLEEQYEQKLHTQLINKAFASLSEIQQRRIYAYCILEVSQTKIATIEGVSLGTVNGSIQSGLKTLNKILNKFL